MQAYVFRTGCQQQVFDAIISLVPVFVMDDLVFGKRPTK
jgi:hypothetical protein